MKTYNWEGVNPDGYFLDKLEPIPSALPSFQKLYVFMPPNLGGRSEERFSRNAETELVCRLLLEKKNAAGRSAARSPPWSIRAAVSPRRARCGPGAPMPSCAPHRGSRGGCRCAGSAAAARGGPRH